MTQPDAETFAQHWLAAWNAHDLDAILAHYGPAIEFLSPVAREIVGEGRVRGLDALRAYWRRGLERNPQLRFELVQALAGEDCATILYRNHRGQLAAETFEFGADGRVVRAFACYRPAHAPARDP
jgi:ketosteroid isomerase-like protein